MNDQLEQNIRRAMVRVIDETVEGLKTKTFKSLLAGVRDSIERLANVAVAKVVIQSDGDLRIDASIGGPVHFVPGAPSKPIKMLLDISNTPQNLNIIAQLDTSRGMTLVGHYHALQTDIETESPPDPRPDAPEETTGDGKEMPKWWHGVDTEAKWRDETGLGFNAAARLQDKIPIADLALSGGAALDEWNDGVIMYRGVKDKDSIDSFKCEKKECIVDWFTMPESSDPICPVCGTVPTQAALPLSKQTIDPVFSDGDSEGQQHNPDQDGPADPTKSTGETKEKKTVKK